MKTVTENELTNFLESLQVEYDVRAPIELHDGTRTLGRLSEGPLAIGGGRIHFKPTRPFFPQSETLFSSADDIKTRPAAYPNKPFFVLGMTAQDLDCLEFIDKFFAADFRDDIYFSKRTGAIIAGISGRCGDSGEFLRIAGGKCDLELIYDGSRYLVVPYSGKGRELEKRIAGDNSVRSLEQLRKESNSLPDEDLRTLKTASRLMRQQRVPDAFWQEIADRCIACSCCNYVCPTCTCFEVHDRRHNSTTERRRIWDSCQFDGFMREASGHNPMGAEMLRTRRRIHHKLVADIKRWGHITCFLCGRCDDACPTGIGMKAVCRDIVARFGPPLPDDMKKECKTRSPSDRKKGISAMHSNVIIEVLERASREDEFIVQLTELGSRALKDYNLTWEERAALVSGDIRWIENHVGKLTEPQKIWLNCRLQQEIW